MECVYTDVMELRHSILHTVSLVAFIVLNYGMRNERLHLPTFLLHNLRLLYYFLINTDARGLLKNRVHVYTLTLC